MENMGARKTKNKMYLKIDPGPIGPNQDKKKGGLVDVGGVGGCKWGWGWVKCIK